MADSPAGIEVRIYEKNTARPLEQKLESLGTVSVDSGQLLLVDPCYLKNWMDGEYRPETPRAHNNYDECCRAANSEKRAGQVLKGRAIDFMTAYGDGEYPVYAIRNSHGAIVGVLVDMR